MMQPKRTKFRKQFKGRNRGLAQRGNTVAFGEYGLKATDRCRLTARQIEAARRAMTRYVKRGGKVWIRIFPDKPVTAKPLEPALYLVATPIGRAAARATSSSTWLSCSPVPSSTRWRVSLKRSRAKRSAWRLPSCPSAPRS